MLVRSLCLVSVLACATCAVLAQAASSATDEEAPVAWTFTLGNDAGAHAVLAEATVAPGWYIYSQFLDEGGPVPTYLDLSATPEAELLGAPTEDGDAIAAYDELFGMDIVKYAGAASFTQGLRLPAGATAVEGAVEFMACTKVKCLPPTSVPFTLSTSR